MVAATWLGGVGDWATGADWSTGSEPNNDAVVINSGAVTISGLDIGDVTSLTMTGGSLDVQNELGIGDEYDSPPNFMDTNGGTLLVSGGELMVGGYLTSATGTVYLTNAGTYMWHMNGEPALAADASGQIVDMGAGPSNFDDTFEFANAYNGTITDFNAGDQIDYNGGLYSISIVDHTIVFDTTTGNLTLNMSDSVNMSDIYLKDSIVYTTQTACFGSGTRIATTRGEVAVEDLKVGDLAVTASGVARPIVWLGHRTWRRGSTRRTEWPVRVLAGAFGEGRPARDLILSPSHAVCVTVLRDVFIPVGKLINGSTVAPVPMDEIDYWHVELESHDVLLSEGLPTESYLDVGNRGWFAGDNAPGEPVDLLAAYSKPLITEGPIVQAVKAQLAARAEEIGWRRTHDMDLHLIVDGTRIDPIVDGRQAGFLFPAEARRVKLVSATFNPVQCGEGEDDRDLGLALSGVEIGDVVHRARAVPLEALTGAVYPQEAAAGVPWRWTAGELALPRELWADGRAQVILRLTFVPDAARRWLAPAQAARKSVLRVVA